MQGVNSFIEDEEKAEVINAFLAFLASVFSSQTR